MSYHKNWVDHRLQSPRAILRNLLETCESQRACLVPLLRMLSRVLENERKEVHREATRCPSTAWERRSPRATRVGQEAWKRTSAERWTAARCIAVDVDPAKAEKRLWDQIPGTGILERRNKKLSYIPGHQRERTHRTRLCSPIDQSLCSIVNPIRPSHDSDAVSSARSTCMAASLGVVTMHHFKGSARPKHKRSPDRLYSSQNEALQCVWNLEGGLLCRRDWMEE